MSELTEKDKLESLEALRRGAYDSFNDRRSYEWKFALAIWTALAVIAVTKTFRQAYGVEKSACGGR